MDPEEIQVYVTGIRKYTKDRDFAKVIKKLVPNYQNVVLGIFKKRNVASLVVRLSSTEAKTVFYDAFGQQGILNIIN